MTKLGLIFNVTECDEWYMYSFDDDIEEEDKVYFGYNTGSPMSKSESEGMLKGGHGILEHSCPEVNKSVPYFKFVDTVGENRTVN